jgi:hypothetical protein
MGDGDHDQDHAQPGPVANSTYAMVRDAGEACSCSAPSSRATIALVMSFSTNSRPALRAAASGGRPRPAAPRRDGRDRLDALTPRAPDELSSLVVPANRQNVIARLQERLCLGPWIGDPTTLAHRYADAVSVRCRSGQFVARLDHVPEAHHDSFVRPATAYALTVRAGPCSRCRDSSGALPTRLVVTEGGSPPSPELATMDGRLRASEHSPAVPSSCPSWAALGPRTIGNRGSATDNSGNQAPRSEPIPAHRHRSKKPLTSTLKATVRGSSPWRRTPISPGQARHHGGPFSLPGLP